eukprot:362504-Chlamydomonas_euryale.AAC.2
MHPCAAANPHVLPPERPFRVSIDVQYLSCPATSTHPPGEHRCPISQLPCHVTRLRVSIDVQYLSCPATSTPPPGEHRCPISQLPATSTPPPGEHRCPIS